MAQVVAEPRDYLPGWRNYFGLADTPGVFGDLDQWTRVGDPPWTRTMNLEIKRHLFYSSQEVPGRSRRFHKYHTCLTIPV